MAGLAEDLELSELLERLHPRDILRFLNKRKWTLLAGLSIVLLFTWYFTYTATPLYMAQTKLGVRDNPGDVLPGSGSTRLYYLERLTMGTNLQLIRSRPVVSRVVATLGLADPEKDTKLFEQKVAEIQGAVQVDQVEGTLLFIVAVRHADPVMAKKLADTVSEAFIAWDAENRMNSVKRTMRWLSEQLYELEHKVETSQQQLIDYIRKERVTVIGGRGTGKGKDAEGGGLDEGEGGLLGELQGRLSRAQLELDQKRKRYKEKYPEVQELKEEIGTLRQRIAAEQVRLTNEKEKQVRYEILELNAESNKKLYDVLINKLKEIDLSQSIVQSDLYVVESAAAPGAPFYPNPRRNFMLGIMLGLMLGFASAMLQESMDRTFKSAEDIKRHLNLPVLGMIPTLYSNGNGASLRKGEKPSAVLLSQLKPTTVEAEAFRVLRTNLRFSVMGQPKQTLLVTSTSPREGKTTIAGNLAITNARSGMETLLIDADLHRANVHTLFKVPNAKGLTNLLLESGGADFDAFVVKGPVDNLYLLPSGPLPPNPAELLESRAFVDLLQKLKSHFDYIIIDSPPLGAVADATSIVPYVDGVVFVVKAEEAERAQVKRVVEQLRKSNTKIYGVAFNHLMGRTGDYYYYYSKYTNAPS